MPMGARRRGKIRFDLAVEVSTTWSLYPDFKGAYLADIKNKIRCMEKIIF